MSFRIALYDVAKSAMTSLTEFYLSSNQLISEFAKGLKIVTPSGLGSGEAALKIEADSAEFALIATGQMQLSDLASSANHQAIFDSYGNLTYKDSQILVYKASDQSVNLTTFANDAHLAFPIGANEVWAVEVQVFMKNNQTDYRDVNYRFTVPSGCTNKGSGWFYDNVSFGNKLVPDHDYSAATNQDLTLQRMFKQLDHGYVQTGIIKGLFKNGSTAGTIQLQWAKDMVNSPTSSCTIFALSYLKAQMIL